MIKITGSVPVKTRLPLMAWVLAGLVTLFSMVSSLRAHFTRFKSNSVVVGAGSGGSKRGSPGQCELVSRAEARRVGRV